MARKRFSPEQIITMLREAEVLLNQSNPVAEVCRKLGVSEQTYYRWRKEYGGMRVDQAKRLNSGLRGRRRARRLSAGPAAGARNPASPDGHDAAAKEVGAGAAFLVKLRPEAAR